MKTSSSSGPTATKNSHGVEPIAHIHTPFKEKFGVPRQAGLAGGEGRIVFLPEYRSPESVRGLEEFDYIWLLWSFHLSERPGWSPTVRPPRLGGNARVGVFATRSPFRPNNIGLSSVRLLGVETDAKLGPVIHVGGVDLVDGTPIYDIKPYIAYTDSHPDARCGFAQTPDRRITVLAEDRIWDPVPEGQWQTIVDVLSQDPRPHYHHDSRGYAVRYDRWDVHFHVEDDCRLVVDRIDDCGLQRPAECDNAAPSHPHHDING